MKVAYIRVSTKEQNTARQEAAMKAAGVEKVYTEKISGKDTNRPQLKAMLDFVREGDTLIVESYSRLARDTKDLLEIVDGLNKKGVAFVSLKENIDTSTPQGKFTFTIFAGLAEFERSTIKQRQREGIEIAKAAGKYTGRKPIDKPENFDHVVSKWQAGEITARAAMKELKMTASTFYRKLKEN